MKYLFLVSSVLAGLFCPAQNDTKKWYFGTTAALDFTANPPGIIATSAMTVNEGCASVADASANLLFYTDGSSVWNRLNVIMSNGTGLLGNQSASQSCIIIKKPSSSNLYYIFTLQGSGGSAGLNYSVVDMNLSAGNGSVVVKNSPLYSAGCPERITATKHCNGQDYWVLIHQVGSNNFRSYLLTSAGVNTVAVVSPVGTNNSFGDEGCMKISPNGKKVGVVNFSQEQVELYDFDNSTGAVTNSLVLSYFFYGYGCEFSPDATKFYASSKYTSKIIQWDLCAGSNAAIVGSAYIISVPGNFQVTSMQLAPNGKIYISMGYTTAVSAINNPNVAGSGCSYGHLAQSISPKTCYFGLPNFAGSSFYQPPPSPPFTQTVVNTIQSCQTASFTAPTATACPAAGYSVTSMLWDFGDPASGSANTSTLANPTHYYSGIGTFTAQLILYSACGGGLDTLRQQVIISQPCVSFVSSGISCSTLGSATVNPGGNGPFSYTWMPGAFTGSVATGLSPGTYTVTIFDAGTNASYTVATTFTSPVALSGSLSSTGSLTCNNINTGTASIGISGGSPNQYYVWTNGVNTQTNAFAVGLGAGNYTVAVTDALTGCALSQTFSISQPPPLTLNLASGSPSACTGNSVALTSTASGGVPPYSYSWTSGPANASCNVTQFTGGTYMYTSTATDANSCTVTRSISVIFVNNPVLGVLSSSICPGFTGTLTVSGASSYSWNPGGSAGASFTASPGSTSIYTVTGSALGCTSNATGTITVKALPALSFITYSITCASLGSATVIPTGGTGPFNFTWMPTAQTFSVANNLNPNTYTLTTFDAGTGCTSTATTVFTSLIPLTGTLFNTDSVPCNGSNTGTATVTGLAGGSPNQNYLWSNGTSSLSTQSVTNLGAGNWSVTVTDVLTGCQIFSVFAITQPPALTLNLSSSSPTACVTDSIILTSTLSGGVPGYTFNWTSGPASATNIVNRSVGGTYVYTLNIVDAHSCSATKTIVVGFVNNPVLTITNSSICPLQTGTISVGGASNYTWSTSSNASSITDSPLATTLYTVTGEALGCVSADTATITVMPTPNALIGSNSPRCEQTQLNLFSVGGSSYTWTGPLFFTSLQQYPVVNPVQLNQSGVYNVTVTAANGCTASVSTTITVNPIPTVAATGATVCTTQTLNLSAVSVAGAAFAWNGPAAFLSLFQNPAIFNPPLNATGTYSVIATSPQGCTNIAVANALVVDPPSLVTTLSSPSVCAQALSGSSNTIMLNASGGANYTLTTPSHITTSSPPPWSLISVPPYSAQIVIATATLAGSNGICSSSTTASFSVIPNPTVGVSNPTPVICAGETFTYTSNGAQSYTWTSATPNYTSYSNGGVAVTNPSINSVFSIVGSSLGCNSALVTSSITVYPLPEVSVSPASTNICTGSPALLVASGNAQTYEWSPPNGLNTTVGATVLARPGVPMQYVVVGTANNCTNMAVANVSLLPLPSPTAAVTSPTICLNENVVFSAAGGVSYVWHGPNQIVFAGNIVTVTASGQIFTGSYTLTATDANGCSNTATTFIRVMDLPMASLAGKMSGCAPLCSEFRLWSSSDKIIPTWKVEGIKITAARFSHCFTKPGEFIIEGQYVDQSTGCINGGTYTVSVSEVPKADFYWVPEKPVEGIDDVLFINSTEGKDQSRWTWAFLSDKGYKSTQENTSYFFRDAGDYPVALVVRNAYGCSDTAVKYVRIEADFACYIPNVFTPNTDSKNEVFLPIVRGVDRYSLTIFNRWGEMVFSTNDPIQGWDGTFHGESCKQDVYAYKISLVTVHGDAKEYTGQVVLYK